MKIIGLTGSIGMGKSTAAKMFAKLGIRVLDSDQIVHRLYKRGGKAVGAVADAFPTSLIEGAIDRKVLAGIVLKDKSALKKLETIVHRLVREIQDEFILKATMDNQDLVILEIPLLFEVGADKWLDNTIVVSANADIQKERVLARPNMNKEKLAAILDRQMPDHEKRSRADYIIETSTDLDTTFNEVKQVLNELTN